MLDAIARNIKPRGGDSESGPEKLKRQNQSRSRRLSPKGRRQQRKVQEYLGSTLVENETKRAKSPKKSPPKRRLSPRRQKRVQEYISSKSLLGDDSLLGMDTSSSERMTDESMSETMVEDLWDMAEKFKAHVMVQDRKFRFRSYPNCFVGSEACDVLLELGLVGSRLDAVQCGRLMAHELSLFQHVCGDHEFEDDYFFYRFCGIDNAVNFSSNFLDTPYTLRDLEDVGRVFQATVKVKNRKYRFKSYKSCFVGSQACDTLIDLGYAATREEAVRLANVLNKQLHLFQHVCGEHGLEDGHLFYRFREFYSYSDGSSALGPSSEELSCRNLSSRCLQNHEDLTQEELMQLATKFKALVKMQDRTYRLKSYKNCFVGAEACDALVMGGLVNSREDAVCLGRTLARELGFFLHVCNEHVFSDEYLFFRYAQYEFEDHSPGHYVEESYASEEFITTPWELQEGEELFCLRLREPRPCFTDYTEEDSTHTKTLRFDDAVLCLLFQKDSRWKSMEEPIPSDEEEGHFEWSDSD